MKWIPVTYAVTVFALGGCLSSNAPDVSNSEIAPTKESVTSAPGFSEADRQALLQRGTLIVDTCMEHMPDTQATRDALSASGFRQQGLDDGMHLYSQEGRRLMAGVSASGSPPACFVMVSQMTVAEAEVLARPWVDAMDGQPAPPQAKKMARYYRGSFKGGPVGVAIFDDWNLSGTRGALVMGKALR
ncbi:MAG: hypothetical protein AAGA38_14445 [Pseudomonadota bacterium]